MATYVWTAAGFIDKDTGAPMALPEIYRPAKPMVISDLEPYESPASGKMITSRSQQREDLAATGCRLVDPSESPTKGKLRNPRFAKKHGLTVADEFKDYDASEDRREKERLEAQVQ